MKSLEKDSRGLWPIIWESTWEFRFDTWKVGINFWIKIDIFPIIVAMYFPQVINDSSQRLELKFRPDDPYCRPTCSEKVSCRGLVVKMKIIKKRKKSGKETLEIIPQVMGKVSSCYRFRGKSTVFNCRCRTSKCFVRYVTVSDWYPPCSKSPS